MADGKVVIQADFDGSKAQSGVSKLKGLFGGLSDAGTKMGSVFKSVLGANLVSSAIINGVSQLTDSVKGVFSTAISEGAKLQQSIGGIETLFKDSADKVKANADKAFETVGISANEYMENVTSFSASLLSSLGNDTSKAADVANTAMIDMADNANKMGTNMRDIQNAYQGFAKQNYTMLDNLKLGYGGTKSEMERLLADAQKLTGVKYDINNLADVYNAIHAIQTELGITGTTAEEAATTLSGSMSSMKAAWSDLLGKIAVGLDIGPALNNLATTTSTFLFRNFLPMMYKILKELPKAISTMIKSAGPEIRKGLEDMFRDLNVDGSQFLKFFDQISDYAKAFFDTFKDTGVFDNLGATISMIGDLLSTVFKSATGDVNAFKDIAESIGDVFNLVLFVAQDVISGITAMFSSFANTGAFAAVKDAFYSLVKAGLDVSEKLSGILPWETIGTAAGHIVKFIADIVKAVADFIQSIDGDIMRGLVQSLMYGVAGFKAFNFLSSFNPFSFFKKNATEGVDGATNAVKRSKSTISQLFSGLSNLIKSSATAFKTAFTGLATGLKTVLTGAATAFKTALSGFAPVLRAFGAMLKTAGVANIIAFGAAVGIAAVGIGASLALIASQGAGLSQIIGAIGDVFANLATAIIGVLANALVTVAGVLPIVAGSFALLSPLVTAFGDAIATVILAIGAVAPQFGVLAMAIGNAVATIIDAVAGLVTAFTPIIHIIADAFVQITTVVADAIVQIVQTLAPFIPAVTEMVVALAPILSQIVDAFNNLISQISPILDSLANLFESFGDAVKTVLDGVKEVIDSVGNTIRSALDGVAGIFDSMGNAAKNAGQGVKLMAQGIKILVDLKLGDLVGTLTAVATGLGAIASSGIATAGPGLEAAGIGMQLMAASAQLASIAIQLLPTALTALSTSLTTLPTMLTVAGTGMMTFATSAQASVMGLMVIGSIITQFANMMMAIAPAAAVATAGLLSFNSQASAAGSAMSRLGSASSKALSMVTALGAGINSAMSGG